MIVGDYILIDNKKRPEDPEEPHVKKNMEDKKDNFHYPVNCRFSQKFAKMYRVSNPANNRKHHLADINSVPNFEYVIQLEQSLWNILCKRKNEQDLIFAFLNMLHVFSKCFLIACSAEPVEGF